MQNESGHNVDLYIPRKCSWTNQVVHSKDHAAVQINVGDVDENGVYTQSFKTFTLGGYIRSKGEADSALTDLVKKADAQS